jgi:hypothetical protein
MVLDALANALTRLPTGHFLRLNAGNMTRKKSREPPGTNPEG